MSTGTEDVRVPLPPLLSDHLDLLVCPACAGALRLTAAHTALECTGCARAFPFDGDIPLMFWPAEHTDHPDVTEMVKMFYEATPFPNYDDADTPERLRAKAEQGVFARLLDKEVKYGARVLECGCGTGQLSNYLGLTWGRTVVGTDLCLNSLRLADGFRRRHDVASASFLQMNLFRPVLRPESFDVVISNGVLHHTGDPYGGFRSILRCLKPGGFVIIGLYNTFGRLTTDFRRLVFRLSGDRLQFLDPRLRRHLRDPQRRAAWFKDQYKHPHESKHSFGEVQRWFDASGVEFVSSIPRSSATARFRAEDPLFQPTPRGTARDHFLVQTGMLLSGGREGGFFVMIGRKRR